MRRWGRFGPWVAAAVVVVLAGGFVPRGLLRGHTAWVEIGIWALIIIAAVVVISAGVKAWRRR